MIVCIWKENLFFLKKKKEKKESKNKMFTIHWVFRWERPYSYTYKLEATPLRAALVA